MTIVYRGFSTFNFNQRGDSMSITNIELIKRDILNAIFTPIGTVYKNRRYGTSVPNLLMKPMMSDIVQQTEREIKRAILNEPRIQLVSLTNDIDYENKSVTFEISFIYIEEPNIVQTLPLFLNYEG